MHTNTQPTPQPNTYVLATPAVLFAHAFADIQPTVMLEGTLGMRQDGRIEFVLKDGGLLFNAHASQARTGKPILSNFGIAIESHIYTFALKIPNITPDKSKAVIGQWQELLEKYKTVPADGRPAIVTDIPGFGAFTFKFFAFVLLLLGPFVAFTAVRIEKLNFFSPPVTAAIVVAYLFIAGVLPIGIMLIRRVKNVERTILERANANRMAQQN